MLKAKVSYPQYLLEVVQIPDYLPGVNTEVASHAGIVGSGSQISPQNSRIQAGYLHPGDWTYSVGTATISVRSSSDYRTLPRGLVMRLRVGFHGWAADRFEPVFLGQLQDVKFDGVYWAFELRSLVGALHTRWTENSINSQLFYQLATTTLTVAYTAGATDITVDDTTGLAASPGGDYLVQIFPDDGDPFFLVGTSKTATTVTGLSAAAQIGTTAGDAAIGNEVVLCAYIEQHPVDVALTVLTSTGVGDNGPNDTAVASWGLGLPHDLIDFDDCETTKSATSPASGSTVWDVYSTGAVEDASSWLREILQPAGMWIGERQGLITIRAATPNGEWYDIQGLVDEDIVEIRGYSSWSPNQTVEYAGISTTTASGTGQAATDTDFATRPTLIYAKYELPYSEENETAWANKNNERLQSFVFNIAEEFEVVCLGWRLATLTPGDGVYIQSRFFSPRAEGAYVAFVVSVQPDWFGATTTLRLIIAPEYFQIGAT